MSYKKFLKRLGKGNPRKAIQSVKVKGRDLDASQRAKFFADLGWKKARGIS